MENLLDPDGKRVLFNCLIPINLNQLFTIASNIIFVRLILGYKANFKVIVSNTNGWMTEMENGSVKNFQYLQIHRLMTCN